MDVMPFGWDRTGYQVMSHGGREIFRNQLILADGLVPDIYVLGTKGPARWMPNFGGFFFSGSFKFVNQSRRVGFCRYVTSRFPRSTFGF